MMMRWRGKTDVNTTDKPFKKHVTRTFIQSKLSPRLELRCSMDHIVGRICKSKLEYLAREVTRHESRMGVFETVDKKLMTWWYLKRYT